jgi:hypothetical protein
MTFSIAAARLDALETIQNDWPGFGPPEMTEVIAFAEAQLWAVAPATADDRDWLYARFERALANQWCDEAKAPLLSALARAKAA